ncbi:MAG: hypothetical protein BroJett003_01580 [Planctomycetota bacterium]|nr:MAG: hypothetical protein BroJett003_01580 [Planctomycetota bacterium]
MALHLSTARRGFTLLELSVVLVIIGLVAGGILVGSELIALAELKSVMRQLESYNTAVNTFRVKYGGLPGDFVQAVEYGLGDAGCPTANPCPATPTGSYDYAGCNGNGNGRLDDLGVGTDLAWCPENLNFWHHLSRASLIEGSYDGKTLTGGGWEPQYGISSPVTKLRGIGIWVMLDQYYLGIRQGDGAPQLSTKEAAYLDEKMDDALPLTGRVRLLIGFGCNTGNSYNTRALPGVTPELCSLRISGIPGFQ